MFLDRWIPEKYLIKQEVCALEFLYSEGQMSVYYIWLKNKNNKLSVVQKGRIEGVEQLPRSIVRSKIPVIAVVNGKGVLFKKVNVFEDVSDIQVMIRENLPAISSQDFYIQFFDQGNGTGFLSFCRKTLVDPLIESMIKAKIVLAEVLIGSPSILALKPLWSKFNTIPCSTHVAELENDHVLGMTPITTEDGLVTIEGIELPKECVLGFSAALSYLLRLKLYTSEVNELVSIKNKYKEAARLKLYVAACVAIAFCVSITNVVFYTSYFDRNNKIEAELSVYQGKYDQINALLTDYQSKKDLIEGAGVFGKDKLSEYADRIAASIPEEIVLASMVFNPERVADESVDSLASFRKNEILIKGNCNKSLVVNEWLNVLKMQGFVSSVSLEKFNYAKEQTSPNFELIVITK